MDFFFKVSMRVQPLPLVFCKMYCSKLNLRRESLRFFKESWSCPWMIKILYLRYWKKFLEKVANQLTIPPFKTLIWYTPGNLCGRGLSSMIAISMLANYLFKVFKCSSVLHLICVPILYSPFYHQSLVLIINIKNDDFP